MNFSHILKSKKNILNLFYAVILAFLPVMSFAQQDSTVQSKAEKTLDKAEGKDDFNPSEVILEHIADSHFIHVGGDTFLPLPVILYTDKGFEYFSSSNFGHHGTEIYKGNHTYKIEENKVRILDETGKVDEEAKIYDFSITKNVVSLWMSVILLLIIFLSIARSYKKTVGQAPRGLQSFMEPIIVFVRDDIAIPNIGHKYQRFMPLLLTVFFFIWINNLIGLVPFFPGGANLTGNIAVTLVLSVITLIVVNVNGNKYYWKHIFLPDVPFWLYPIMWPVELVGVISKPFALMIRLFANITAGHIIVLSLISLIFVFKAVAVSAVSVPFVVFMDVLELLVALLQAFIFTLLTALFIGTAVEEHHH